MRAAVGKWSLPVIMDMFGIHDAGVRAAIQHLPVGCFVRTYVERMSGVCDAPDVYHLGVALSLMANAVSPDSSIASPGRPLRANLYTLITGVSGGSRKTTAIEQGTAVALAVYPERIGGIPGSQQGLLAGLNAAPHQIKFFSEFSVFLSNSARNKHMEPVRTGLIDAYDNGALSKELSKETIVVPFTRLSLLAACTPDLLSRYLSVEDISGGFLGRFLLLPGHRGSRWVEPQETPAVIEEELQNMLRHRILTMPAVSVTLQGSPVQPELITWAKSVDARIKTVPPEIAGALSRTVHLAYKIGLILTIDAYACTQRPDTTPSSTTVTGIAHPGAFRAAMAIANLHADAAKVLAESLAVRPTMILSNHAKATMVRAWAAGQTPTDGDLTRATGCLLTQLKPVTQTLCVEGFCVAGHTTSHTGTAACQTTTAYTPGPSGQEMLDDVLLRRVEYHRAQTTPPPPAYVPPPPPPPPPPPSWSGDDYDNDGDTTWE